MGKRAVDKDTKKYHVEDIAPKAYPTSHTTRNQCGGNDCKFELKEGKHQEGYRARKIRVRLRAYTMEGKVRQGVSDNTSQAITKSETKAHDNPQDTYHPQGYKTLEHSGYYILLVDHAAIEKGQAWSHE
jgi:hypothetical protein